MREQVMNAKRKRQPSGQALILMALALIGLFGFSGVALDGGMLYFERRRAQNAADNAALAAALRMAQLTSPTLTVAQQEAREVANANGYNNDQSTNWVDVYWPPSSGTYDQPNSYIQVVIRQTVPTQLIHMVYSGPVELTVEAVAWSVPGTYAPPVANQALVALDPTACNALEFNGNGTVTLVGGGAMSNSNASPPPTSCNSARATGSAVINNPDGFDLVGSYNWGSASVTGGVTTVSPLDLSPTSTIWPNEALLDAMCAQSANSLSPLEHEQNGGTQAIGPGNYTEITVRAGGVLTMSAGLYCVTGSDGFDTSGGSITADHVLIYLWNGPFETNGMAANYLSGVDDANCDLPAPTVDVCDFRGMLMYARLGNTSTMRINGSAESYLSGTIFTPDAPVEISGNSGNTVLASQVIGRTIHIAGNGNVTIDFDPNLVYMNRKPSEIRLNQ